MKLEVLHMHEKIKIGFLILFIFVSLFLLGCGSNEGKVNELDNEIKVDSEVNLKKAQCMIQTVMKIWLVLFL